MTGGHVIRDFRPSTHLVKVVVGANPAAPFSRVMKRIAGPDLAAQASQAAYSIRSTWIASRVRPNRRPLAAGGSTWLDAADSSLNASTACGANRRSYPRKP